MSTSPILGFPEPGTTPPAYSAYGVTLGDVASTTAAVNRALASLSDRERGALTVQLNRTGAGAGLIVRGPFSTAFLATVAHPAAGGLDWQVAGRVSFVLGSLPGEEQPVTTADLRAFHTLLRKFGNGRMRAAMKTWRAAQGRPVPLLP